MDKALVPTRAGGTTERTPVQPARPASRGEAPRVDLSRVPVHRPDDSARAAVGGATAPLPHIERIQASFGRHAMGGVRAAIGGAATGAIDHLDAQALAVGERVAFREAPDLRLAAHEAAHVVQQRSASGAGRAQERRADEIADVVARGGDAEPLLGPVADRGARGEPVVQLKPRAGHRAGTITLTWTGDSDDFLHAILDKTEAHFHIDQGSLIQNFDLPIRRAFYAIATTSPKGRIKLDIEFDYDPDDANNVTGVSNVSIKKHVDAAPAATTSATKAPASAPAPAKASVPPAPVPDDAHPPADETLAQRISQQARQTAKVFAQDVADADRDGYARIDFVVESDGNEIIPSYMNKTDQQKRPSGVPLISAGAARADIGSMLDLLAGSPGTKWRYALEYKRGAGGAMSLGFWKRIDVAEPVAAATTTAPISDKAMMREYGIPDRAEIYAEIFQKANAEIKESAIQIASFGAEQIVLWIAGGWLFGLGLLGEAAFPRLAALLRIGGEAEVTSALNALDGAEGEELSALMKKIENGETLNATETSRLSELYGEVEQGLNRTAGRELRMTFTKAMKSSADVIARGPDIDKVDVLVQKFGGKATDWVKYKTWTEAGVEVHWYECPGVGKVGIKYAGELDPF